MSIRSVSGLVLNILSSTKSCVTSNSIGHPGVCGRSRRNYETVKILLRRQEQRQTDKDGDGRLKEVKRNRVPESSDYRGR